jgi:hypothetical protein
MIYRKRMRLQTLSVPLLIGIDVSDSPKAIYVENGQAEIRSSFDYNGPGSVHCFWGSYGVTRGATRPLLRDRVASLLEERGLGLSCAFTPRVQWKTTRLEVPFGIRKTTDFSYEKLRRGWVPDLTCRAEDERLGMEKTPRGGRSA